MKVLIRVRRRGRSLCPTIQGPTDVVSLLAPEARGLDRECFWRLDLDARNAVVAYELVSIGTLTAALVHPREVFKGALLANAAGVILAHNHPSDDVSPSPEDRETTARLKRAGELLGVPLLDHVILGSGAPAYFSFREAGLL